MAQPSFPTPPPPASSRAAGEPPLVALDRALLAGGGAIFVRVGDEATRLALSAHIARRAQSAGRAVAISHDPLASVGRELLRKLGARPSALDPLSAAQSIAVAAEAERALVVFSGGALSHWDAEVRGLLSREVRGKAALAVFLDTRPISGLDATTEALSLDDVLTEAELALVWEGIAFEARQRSAASGLASVQAFWASAEQAPREASPAPLSEAAGRFLARLSLSRRSLSLSEATHLCGISNEQAHPRELSELVARGLVILEERAVVLTREGRERAEDGLLESQDLSRAARVLSESGPTDPSALAHAAELFARAGEAEAAEATIALACTHAEDPSTRADIAAGFHRVIELLPPARRLDCRLRAAEAALSRGDTDHALAWARAAVDAAPLRYEALLLLGRAALARGDLVTATVGFDRAAAAATCDGERARVALERAEARYAAGDLEAAEGYAAEAIAQTSDAATRLGARNVLGKLLLARARWAEAEAHFAADELDASSEKTAGLRAKLNRAIAVLSSGRGDEARWMLEAVLSVGEAQGDARAVAFALSNLAVLATLRHDYAEALQCSERSIEMRRKLCDKIGLARAIINLAELRLRLGLVAEAEQALAFARQAMSPGMPASRVTEAALVAGHIHLARGRTLEASRELSRALSHAPATSDGEKLSECERLGARIALEDGDIERARGCLARARGLSTSTRGEAEIALLEASASRAAGEEACEQAAKALLLSRQAGDEDLMREAHWLLFELHRARGDEKSSRAHLELTIALRDKVADRLPPELRRSFLARRDLAPLSAIEQAELAPAVFDDEPSPPSRRETRERALVGEAPQIVSLVAAIAKVATSDATILVRGESGTGKELVAEAIHRASGRAGGPLVKVNCAALVETLLLSELFGHERGAFTGAVGRRRGRFEIADGGTLFLDEIGDISPRTQVALLRVLEQRTFERVGGTTTIRADVRIVCATHRDLRKMVERGEFREDLYYRLRGITLEVPPLRARMEDLGRLAAALLDRIGGERGEAPKRLGHEALALLGRHHWPGNVRELENALRAASLFAEGQIIEARDLVDNVEGLRTLGAPSFVGVSFDDDEDTETSASFVPVEASATEIAYAQVREGGLSLGDLKRQIERACIARALDETQGNITRAAALLGMKRPRLSQLVKQYNLGAVSEGS